MFKLTCVCGVFCVHLSCMAVVVASLRKRGRVVSCGSSVLSVVAFILDQFKSKVDFVAKLVLVFCGI